MRLVGKKILLGVTAGIAAYKIPLLVRLFKKQGALVKVVMTPSARDFVTPLTLATLSENPVLSDFFDPSDGVWSHHVALANWADLMLIAPATANIIAKMAHGHCDNLLLSIYLSASCPVYIAPAMDLEMYRHNAVRNNIEILEKNGDILIPSQYGSLASGLVGYGRMESPKEILNKVISYFNDYLPLQGKTVLITAGPTYESIDPVRFIGNHSSGKMGFSLAICAEELGASVILITGPTTQKLSETTNINRVDVVDATQMYDAVHRYFSTVDIAVFSAAVSDYRPVHSSNKKIKKKADHLSIDLVRTVDILKSVTSIKSDDQFVVGFALETCNELSAAIDKSRKKRTNLMVLNSLNERGAGFGLDTNKVTLIDKLGSTSSLPLMSKKQAAKHIFDKIIEMRYES